MVCNTKIIAPLLLVAGCCFSASSSAVPDEPTVKLSNSWYKATFATRFPPQGASLPPASGTAVLYRNKADLVGETYDSVFKPAPQNVQTALAATNTVNPFHPQFAALYTPTALRKRAACTMLSTPIELDDKSATKEWVVAFSAVQCLEADAAAALRSGDTTPHQWVLQKITNGKYRILAEGDGNITLTNHQKEQGYKEIRTSMLIPRTFPEHKLQCGGAEFTWHYRNNGYVLAATEILAQDCEPLHFPDLTGAAWQKAYDTYAAQVKTVVDGWLKDQSPVAP
ncbi:MAG: hypothetical protein RL122_2454 [Pseudomonadota bacterium]|jgi:hypothetical protein|uniref:Uncharacterized protein n=1 Tax=Thiothrix fructosivorans TaxID=111770 RepID=A0A8B0SQN8_9GAMM|nr:hypothetical protein [Thiothrix fructosivorans]MBO0612516.1 hypothetical protein [Thiothrix fructosivorans]QTX12007.1 hypothetical protein J1836_006655 [Thiothrix fructosivorans]